MATRREVATRQEVETEGGEGDGVEAEVADMVAVGIKLEAAILSANPVTKCTRLKRLTRYTLLLMRRSA